MTYSRILVATDLSEGALRAAREARLLAHERARFRSAFVAPDPWPGVEDPAWRREALDALERWNARAGSPNAEAVVLSGGVARELAREAEAYGAELVVVGHRGQSRRRILGSTARGVLRTARTDVLVARSSSADAAAIGSILVATDLHAPSVAAAQRALALAKTHAATLELVHCIDPGIAYAQGPDPDEALLREALRDFNARHLDGRAALRLVRGRPAAEIPKLAAVRRVDLVVIGNHGAGALERALLGSVAEGVAEKSRCSVLVVRR